MIDRQIVEQESTRRDVLEAIDLQEREDYKYESDLCFALERKFSWNPFHAEKIAELAWVELYAEKEGDL
jgi:hypothetical protein